MMLRATACCTALVLGLLLTLSAVAAPACEGTECPASSKPAKPLDIMKFMREQAASTRPSKPRNIKARSVVAQAPRRAAKTAAARPEAAGLAAEAAKSFASQTDQNVPVVASDELNAIDRAAAPAETVGAAPSSGQNVQMVDAEEFNDIDRKAYDGLVAEAAKLRADAEARVAPQASEPSSPSSAPRTGTSWLRWIWSATAGTFAALAAAVHQLIG